MKKLLQMKFMLLLCALIVGSGTMWAEETTIASFSASNYHDGTTNGWATNNAEYASANNGYYKLISSDASIVTPNINWSNYKNITITISARKYGGPDATQGKISVSQGTTEFASYSPSGTSIVASSALEIEPADGTITISCPGASSSKGCGVQSIVIKGTEKGGDGPTTYTVTYDANGASSGSVPTDENEYKEGDEVTVLGNTGNLAKEHYTFNNWNTKDDGTGNPYIAGNTFDITANTTLYAQWSINTHTLTLPAADTYGSYSANTTSNEVAYGTEVELSYTPATGYENYAATWSVNGTAIEGNTFTMPDEDVTVTVSVAEKTTTDITIDFESAVATYTDWTFTNMVSQQTNSDITPHGGSYFGTTGAKATASIQTKEKVNPYSLTCYVSKQTTNTTSSTWYIQVSTDGSTWEDATSSSATDMDKGAWKKITADLKNYSNVYVRVYYSGSTAVRCIDDLTLTVKNDTREEAGISYFENEVMIELKDETYDAVSNNSNPLNNPNSLTDLTWTSSDESVATVNQSGIVTLKAVGNTTITASFAGNDTYKPGEASFTLQVVDNRQDATVTWKNANNETITMLDVEKGQYKENFFTVNCNVSGFEFTSSFITQAWDYNKSMPATYIKNENAFSLITLAIGTTTITATFPGNYDFKPASATLTINVTGGTATAPYSVAEARAAIDANTGITNVYAKGIVCTAPSELNSDGSLTYFISEDGATTSDQLQVYKGKSYNGGSFESKDEIQVGDVVIISGTLKKYYSTYEFDSGNKLYFNEPRLTVADADKTVMVNAAGQITNHDAQTITINHRNFLTTAPSANNVSVVFCEENGTLIPEGYDWINPITYNGDGEGYFTMNCSFAENTGDIRTGYAEVAVTIDNTIYYSDKITITQSAPATSHNVTFSVNGTVTTPVSYESGDAINFPTVADIDGMTFLGWTDNEISGTQATANYVTEATMGNADVTYYAVFALLVPGTSTTYTDELTYSLIGVTGTTYSDWSGKTHNSDAVYAGNSAGGNTAIQLRTNNSNSGIVTTDSGGKLKKVSVVWNSNTANERTLDIYGNNDAYSDASDLYSSNTQGTKVGSISKNGTTMELSINGDYEYVGLRSNNGAMYLDKITIEWESGTPDSYTDFCTTIPEMLTVTIAEACTNGGGKYYGTYSSSSAFKVSGNVTVSEIGINNDGTMNVRNYESGAVVPANTGVMVSATTPGNFKLIKSSEAGTSVLDDNNALRPTGDDGVSAADMEGNDSNCKFYRLTMHNGTDIGFWWGNENGTAFAVGSNKAYMAVPTSVAGARNGFAFGDDSTTGISNVNVNENVNGSVFDLQGRKVNKPGKGLYIVNGKKVVIK